jgi:hypothetical protein
VTDPRRREGTYPLINFLVIAVCAVICGADDFVAIAEFGRAKKTFLGKFLDLSAGIPSHDRFNAIFRAIKPAEFEKCLLSWITALHEVTEGQVAMRYAAREARRCNRRRPRWPRRSASSGRKLPMILRQRAARCATDVRRDVWSVLAQESAP